MDFISPIVDKVCYAGAIWIVLAIILLFFKKTRSTGIMLLVGLALTALLGEFIMKPLIGRIRPCNLG